MTSSTSSQRRSFPTLPNKRAPPTAPQSTFPAPHSFPTNSSAFSQVQVTVSSKSPQRAFRGPDPTVARVTLVPTDYRDLISAIHLFGFVAQFVGQTRDGSIVDGDSFFQHPPRIRASLECDVSHTFYKLILDRKKTLFDLLAEILAFLSGLSML